MTMSNELVYKGRNGDEILYLKGSLGVVFDESTNTVARVHFSEELSAEGSWRRLKSTPPSSVSKELANAALTELDITVFAVGDRMYTVPKAAAAEAKRGLLWRKEEGRGGTQVGVNSARTIAKGGQIGIEKVRHIAKYFPRHEVDKRAKGYKPGEDGYPSNGRIAWALWGGDAAQRWASAIVERENKKKSTAAITAAMYDEFYDDRVDLRSFTKDTDSSEFYIRISLDRGAIDRLYRVEEDGNCRIWDDGYWEDMGNVEHDFITYDKALDDAYDKSQKIHVPVDKETAISLAAMFDNEPFQAVFLKQINFDETEMFEQAIPEMDWQLLDQLSADSVDELAEEEEFDDGLMASGTSVFADGVDTTPGVYTDEERSENASQQVRDKLGRFTQTGSRVVIGGDYNNQGNVTGQNPDAGTVSVQLDNGNTVEVPGNTTQEISTFEPISQIPASNLDFTGILGEPRTPIDQPQANLPGRLPALTANNLGTIVNDWGSWTADQRLAPEYEPTPAKPFIPKDPPDINTAMGRYYQGAFNPDGTPKSSWNPAIAANVANEPLLRNWLDNIYGGSSGSYQGGWYSPRVPVEAKKSKQEVYSPGNQRALDKKYNRFASVADSIVAAAAAQSLTPETSDVAPIYMAIVADDDPQSVMELISLVPVNTQSTTPTVFKRKNGKWEKDETILTDLTSPTPPPVVVLDNENLSDVVEQVDEGSADSSVEASGYGVPAHIALSNNSVLRSIMAAGGLDRNRGGAARLRRYWTIGKGGLKIRWNTPGDWTRCNRQLRKYMGPRAKGYCANRHKEMTGVWPGDKRNIGKKKKRALRSSGEPQMIYTEVETLKDSKTIIEEFTLRARAHSAKSRLTGRKGPTPTEYGAQFIIPLVIPEEVETGDGRIFQKNSISMRELPLPLMWQIKSGQGHDGAVVVGQIIHMERTKEGIGNAYGYFDTGSFGKEAERLVHHGFIRGVSADMDKFEADEPELPQIEVSDDESGKTGKEKSDKINITSARVMAVTIVPKPAFQECYIQVVDESNDVEEEVMQPDGIYVDGVNPLDASALIACGMVAGAIPVEPPKTWFDNPRLDKATPLTIDDEGRVFGHIAAWHVDHIGMTAGTRPPRSRSNYAYFHTGTLKTEEGGAVPVGQLTLAGGHAGLEASAQQAMRHYDDTASAFADVHAGEDAYGIWVAGALRPGTTPEQIRAARASAPSGDWRPIKGRLELVAVCQVNVPGFPIARARVASGQVMALVAAGASVLAQIKYDPLAELTAKVSELEAAQYQPQAEDVKSRFSAMRQEVLAARTAELSYRVKEAKNLKKAEDESSWLYMIQMLDDDPENEEAPFSVISRRVRERLAKEGKALPDGSFPIRNVDDLRNAVRAYGRAKPGARARVRKHIMKRAKDLRKDDLIPSRWSTAFSIDGEELSFRERALAVAALIETSQESLMAAGGPCWDGYKQIGMKKGKGGKMVPNCVPDGTSAISNGDITSFADASCPPATQDIQLNLKNRQNAIDNVGYGPLNPAEPNEEFWQDKGERWNISPEEAKTAVCGNCIFFIRTPKILDCIEGGIGLGNEEAQGSIEAGELGYCNALDFKCASERTCNGWAAGGPVTEESEPAIDDSVANLRKRAELAIEFLNSEALFSKEVLTAAGPDKDLEGLTKEEIEAIKQEARSKKAKDKNNEPAKYTPDTQPRDTAGKFRKVLARLKQDLGRAGLDRVIDKVEEAENLDNAGDYGKAAESADDLIGIIDRLDKKALNPDALENIKTSTRELGEVIANLPFAFGEQSQKIRFSDVPPALRDLMEDMVKRVEDKLSDPKDAEIATEEIKSFMSGAIFMSQADISSVMNKLLRLLT